MFRSILSVFLGYVALAVTTMLSGILLCLAFKLPLNPEAPTFKPPTAYILINLVCGLLAAMLGGFVAARLAPAAPRKHAAVLGAMVLVFGILYAVSGRNGPQPMWYLTALPVVGAAGVMLGGLWRANALLKP